MKERPIIFNADMVRAVLDGKKTQTRRIMREQPEVIPKEDEFGKAGFWIPFNAGKTMVRNEDMYIACPFGLKGDRLWVRESFYEHGRWQGGGYDPEDSYFVSDKQVLYPADGIKRPTERKREDFWRSRPSIHMPRWASRITLEITGVRVERLQDISAEDAAAEGLTGRAKMHDFGVFWSSIYGDESWQANPWAWVIEFRRIEVRP